MRAIVLDADPLGSTLAVSLDALVAAADGARPGKRKRGSADMVEALHSGAVQASTPQRLILSLPDHGHAMRAPPPLEWNLAGSAAAAAAPRFEVGASVRCDTLKSPAPSGRRSSRRAPPPAAAAAAFVRLEADKASDTAGDGGSGRRRRRRPASRAAPRRRWGRTRWRP